MGQNRCKPTNRPVVRQKRLPPRLCLPHAGLVSHSLHWANRVKRPSSVSHLQLCCRRRCVPAYPPAQHHQPVNLLNRLCGKQGKSRMHASGENTVKTTGPSEHHQPAHLLDCLCGEKGDISTRRLAVKEATKTTAASEQHQPVHFLDRLLKGRMALVARNESPAVQSTSASVLRTTSLQPLPADLIGCMLSKGAHPNALLTS